MGRQVGPYMIHSLLGVGGMGEVYLAQDPRLDRAIALKILPAELASDPDRIRRFIREARAASGLKHPNVATIYEIGKSDEFHFIAMEYVEGQTLANKISGRPLRSLANGQVHKSVKVSSRFIRHRPRRSEVARYR